MFCIFTVFPLFKYVLTVREAVLYFLGFMCLPWMTEIMCFLSILILTGAEFHKGQEWWRERYSWECVIMCLRNGAVLQARLSMAVEGRVPIGSSGCCRGERVRGSCAPRQSPLSPSNHCSRPKEMIGSDSTLLHTEHILLSKRKKICRMENVSLPPWILCGSHICMPV